MNRSILLFGQPPTYFMQLLKKFGSIHLYTGREDWHGYDWVAMAGDYLSPSVTEDLAGKVLQQHKTFGLINVSQKHLEAISNIVGIWPSEPCNGLVVTPWTDAAGHRHFKTVFFHKLNQKNEESLRTRGKSPEALRYLLVSNALRMHAATRNGKWHGLLNLPRPGLPYAIIPIQKRPVTYHTNNIYKTTEVQFFHQGELYAYREEKDGFNCYHLLMHHRLSGFTAPVYKRSVSQSVDLDGTLSFRSHTCSQQYGYSACCKWISADGKQGVLSAQPDSMLHESAGSPLLYPVVNNDHSGFATTLQLHANPEAIDEARREDGSHQLEDVSFSSVFRISTPAGMPIPRFRLQMDFELAISQQLESMVISQDPLPQHDSTSTVFKATRSLSTEWLDVNIFFNT
jgi:hypothetical protein